MGWEMRISRPISLTFLGKLRSDLTERSVIRILLLLIIFIFGA
jgi:hypothetical protein